jgi:hypothetical protein
MALCILTCLAPGAAEARPAATQDDVVFKGGAHCILDGSETSPNAQCAAHAYVPPGSVGRIVERNADGQQVVVATRYGLTVRVRLAQTWSGSELETFKRLGTVAFVTQPVVLETTKALDKTRPCKLSRGEWFAAKGDPDTGGGFDGATISIVLTDRKKECVSAGKTIVDVMPRSSVILAQFVSLPIVELDIYGQPIDLVPFQSAKAKNALSFEKNCGVEIKENSSAAVDAQVGVNIGDFISSLIKLPFSMSANAKGGWEKNFKRDRPAGLYERIRFYKGPSAVEITFRKACETVAPGIYRTPEAGWFLVATTDQTTDLTVDGTSGVPLVKKSKQPMAQCSEHYWALIQYLTDSSFAPSVAPFLASRIAKTENFGVGCPK